MRFIHSFWVTPSRALQLLNDNDVVMHTIEHELIDSFDGTPIAVYFFGGNGPPILVAHATGFCASMYEPLARDLFDSYSVWGFDARGHGQSGRPASGDFHWDGVASDVAATVRHIRRVTQQSATIIGVGHSMGGAALVRAQLHDPLLFRALWTYEPIIFPPGTNGPHGENPLSEGARRRRATFDSIDDAYGNFASKPPLNVFDPEVLKRYVHDGFKTRPDGSVELRCHRDDEATNYEMGGLHDTFERLADVTIPVAIARGHNDGFGPAALTPEIHAALRVSEHIEMNDLDHFGPFADPVRIAHAIRAYVGDQ